MLWSTGPACTELETHVMDWLVGMLGLPEKFRSSSTGGEVIENTGVERSLVRFVGGVASGLLGTLAAEKGWTEN